MFLGETFYFHSASLHQGVEMGISEFPGRADEMPGGGQPCEGLASHLGVNGNPSSYSMLW